MIYTGKRVGRPEAVSFSEEFFGGKECAIEVKVKVIYDGKGNDIISQYVAFTKVYNEQVRQYGRSRGYFYGGDHERIRAYRQSAFSRLSSMQAERLCCLG
ncbi:hypothetical protein [Sporofaciens sp. JLR.KK001]|jgi:hypothetical protein|uniref:hypothetical protein n=1 Tax=Sporofaciens sp. JLR.KK001 TaxID=3112621 RepID=UPI002FF2A9B7